MDDLLTSRDLPLSDMLLDPNNYRFRDAASGAGVAERRFAEQRVQQAAMDRLRADGLSELKQSIDSNGFIAVERIVVRRWQGPEGVEPKYVVVEGNRRTAALKWLEEDHNSGIEVNASLHKVFSNVPVLEIGGTDAGTVLAIMGIRHVGGVKQWGGHQSARLVYELRHDHEMSANDVGSRLGLSAVEVNRRYRAFNALLQMQESEEYGEYAVGELYPLFHEALVAPRTKAWLDWSDDDWRAKDETARETFYSLISPFTDERGVTRPPKLGSYSDVRELKQLLDNDEAVTSLIDLERPFSDAIAIAKTADGHRLWPAKVRAAVAAIDSVGVRELRRLSEADRQSLLELRDAIAEVIQTLETLEPTSGE